MLETENPILEVIHAREILFNFHLDALNAIISIMTVDILLNIYNVKRKIVVKEFAHSVVAKDSIMLH